MSQKYEKLKTLLKELFQLDQPDLDFGLYRVMHAKSAEVMQFLDKDLLPQVKAAFGQYKSADKAEIEKELAKVIAGIEAAGMDAAQSPKVKDLRERLTNDAVDVGALESEVYDYLFSFFRRYYDQGDFLAKRVYKPGVYAIPYEGEEVTLHWANKDQYYIKTSEYLRDYCFRLDAGSSVQFSVLSAQTENRTLNTENPRRVHFRLADAAEGEHGNVKAAEGKDRVFILAAPDESGRDFIAEEDGEQGKELVIRFEYRPATLTDWPDDVRTGKSKPPAQKDLTALAAQHVLAMADVSLAAWIADLGQPHVTTSGEKADYTRLEAHIKRYNARNTFDYFIHKDLGTFLRRELDFYIKNEVMHLDDVENETAPRVEQYLSKIKVIRKIAGKIIDFLAQLEDFQKKLWLKKKFVIETQYCITLGCIPEPFYAEIACNEAQREEWVKLFAIDEIKGDLVTPGYSKKLTPEFLKAHPTLVVDTGHFDAGFTERLVDEMADVDDQTDGMLFHGENFQSLSLMQTRYREQVKCIYIDPPYNTGSDGFAYKDSYQHSSWATMAMDRIQAGRTLLQQDGVLSLYIDENEHIIASTLLSEIFGQRNKVGDIVWKNSSKNDQAYVSMQHEYLLSAVRDKSCNKGDWTETKEGLDEIYSAFEGFKRQHGSNWKAIHAAAMEWYRQYPESNPIVDSKHYSWMDERGVYFPADISGPNYGQYRYDVPHPFTGLSCKQPASGWRYPEETMKQRIAAGLVHFGDDETTIPNNKTYLKDTQAQSLTSIKYRDGRVASKLLAQMFGGKTFTNPKDVDLSVRFLRAFGTIGHVILDFFAGTGTTGHAVVRLNREDGGRRRFILVEMGDYFDTVLLPRIKKVTFTPEWKDGKPKRLATPEEAEHSPRIVKVVRLESYEDALNNLEAHRTDQQQLLLDASEAQGVDGLKEQYLLRYMLNVETRGSQSLLNVQAFTDPTAYKLKVKRPGSDESREVNVDLLETFNWLIGITVRHIAAPQTFSAAFERNSEKRLCLRGRLKPVASVQCSVVSVQKEKTRESSLKTEPLNTENCFWFRTVTGTTPDGRKTLIIWRKLTGEPEQDNLVLDEWFTKQGYSAKDSEFDLIYVNGGNNLENLKAPDDLWKVRLIEEDFHRLMFEMEGA